LLHEIGQGLILLLMLLLLMRRVKPGCQMPLLEVDPVIRVFQVDGQVLQEGVDKALNFHDLNKGSITKVRHLQHLILIITQGNDLQKLLWYIK
jgi:hypothetical protein